MKDRLKTSLLHRRGLVVGSAAAIAGLATSQAQTVPILDVAPIDDHRVFQRDATSGNPAGFATTYDRGWGAVPVTIQARAAGSLWLRLHDSADGTATPGTGRPIQAAVAVSTRPLAAGANQVTLTLPASPRFYYVDLALSPDMAGAVRIPTPLGVGSITAVAGHSHAVGMLIQYPYEGGNAPSISAAVKISDAGVVYSPAMAGRPMAAVGADRWEKPGNYGVSPYVSTFAAEYLRLVSNQLGVVAALIGHAANGAEIASYSPSSESQFYAALVSVLAHCDMKFEALIWNHGGTDSIRLIGRDIYYRSLRAILDALAAQSKRPFVTMITNLGALWAGIDDDRSRLEIQIACQDLERERGNVVLNRWFDAGYYYSGHLDMTSRIHVARGFYRLLMGTLGSANGGFAQRRGPRLTGAATRARGSRDITLTVVQDGGTALVGYLQRTVNPTTQVEGVATGIDLAKTFNVYAPGGNPRSTKVALDPAKPLTLVNPTTIRLTLAALPPDSTSFDLTYGIDLDASLIGTAGVPSIRDNVVDRDGIPYGRELQMFIGAVFVPAPLPAPPTLSISTPADTAAGALIPLRGAGTGLPPSAIEGALDDGAYAALASPVIRDDGHWSGQFVAPPVGRHRLTVRRAGGTESAAGPAASATINSVPARDALPASVRSRAAALFDASNIATVRQDAAGISPAANLTPVRFWADALGTAGNATRQPNPDPRYAPYFISNARNGLPGVALDSSSVRNGLGATLRTTGVAAMCPLLSGDCTVLTVVHSRQSGPFWSIARTGNPANWSGLTLSLNGYLQPDLMRFGNDTQAAAARVPIGWYGQFLIVVARYQASSGILRLMAAGQPEATATHPDTSAASWDTFGIGLGFKGGVFDCGGGVLHEIALFSGLLSDGDRDVLLAYAARKWSG